MFNIYDTHHLLTSVQLLPPVTNFLLDRYFPTHAATDIFAPNDNITRAELVKLIVCLFECHDSSKKSTFADVSEND
mgnify:CR=1 FL=1